VKVPRAEMTAEIVRYEPDSGRIFWLNSERPKKNGQETGLFINAHGYRSMPFKGCIYLIHRLAWVYMTGAFPARQIDHINHDKLDNRWANLREVTSAQNQQNRKPRRNSKSGMLGVAWSSTSQTWFAQICHNRRVKNLGSYKTPHEAQAAYLKAKAETHDYWASLQEGANETV
jgi:hypothetical protein